MVYVTQWKLVSAVGEVTSTTYYTQILWKRLENFYSVTTSKYYSIFCKHLIFLSTFTHTGVEGDTPNQMRYLSTKVYHKLRSPITHNYTCSMVRHAHCPIAQFMLRAHLARDVDVPCR